MDFYLITGFLGAGKTTFLKEFIKLFTGKRIYLVVNEFGKEGVDGTILKELNAAISEINNGSIFCACRLDKFEDELNKICEVKPDVVITEASGLSDPTNIRKVLTSYKQINYKGSICIVDAKSFKRIVTTARVCPKQLSVSSLVLINKTDLVSEEDLQETEDKILSLVPYATLKRTVFGKFESQWLNLVSPDIVVDEASEKKDLTLQKQDIFVSPRMTESEFNNLLRLLCEDTYRVKGFVKIGNKVLLADCTGSTVKTSAWIGDEPENIGHITALAGQSMNLRKTIKIVKDLYNNLIEV